MIKILLKRLPLIIAGFLLALVLLEASLRIAGSAYLSVKEYRNRLSVRKTGEYRILCLGESMTDGQWPGPLEKILNQRGAGIKFSVIDEGMAGATTDIIIECLEKNIEKYKPNMIIAMIGINNDPSNTILPLVRLVRDKNTAYFLNSLRILKLLRLIKLSIFPGMGQPEPYTEDIRSGRWYEDQQDYDKAEAAYKEAIQKDPGVIRSYIILSEYYRARNEYAKAEEITMKALSADPEDAWPYIELAWCYYGRNRYDKAEEILKRGMLVDPDNIDLIIEAGRCYEWNGMPDKAAGMFKKAFAINPKNMYVSGSLSRLYRKTGNKPEAEKFYSICSSLSNTYYNPETRDAYNKIRNITMERGIRLVCAQYPMMSVDALKKLLNNSEDVIFVDNESIFKDAVRDSGYDRYFRDRFMGFFGHCTQEGNRMLAENIADTIISGEFAGKGRLKYINSGAR
ncbi:MAG: tetratricopeptide repeat protein [Elusimicrobia bacterium]|nr:tetratricopeptide repeat protein [Elusimicrobiota bacterium]